MACSEVAAFLQTTGMLGYIIFRIFSSQCHNNLVFAARQIANNLSPITKKFELFFLVLRIILFKRTSNNLACALQVFSYLFCARFVQLKTGLSNRNLTEKDLKIKLCLHKRQTFFAFFFLRLQSEVTNSNTSPTSPSFENFSLDILKSEQKPSVKKSSRPSRSETC